MTADFYNSDAKELSEVKGLVNIYGYIAPFLGAFLFCLGGIIMNRVALIGIIIEDKSSIENLNALLYQYREYIIGRMGLPYGKRNINIISVAIDAPQDTISSLSGKLGMLPGVSSKTVYAKLSEEAGK